MLEGTSRRGGISCCPVVRQGWWSSLCVQKFSFGRPTRSEEQRREQEARCAWETRASSWHTSLLAIEGVVLLLLICCGLRIRGWWTSYKEASTHSDTWHGEQDSDQVGMASDSGQEDVWPPHSIWCSVATVLKSWTPKEGWEDMDGSPASVERALQALAERLPEEEKATAGRVGWMFLMALSQHGKCV